MSNEEKKVSNFIRTIIDSDNESGKHQGKVATRFPPEPNGYLHIGHAKSICLNFGLAGDYSGTCNLRFDDTNPTKEDQEYVDAIQEDVRWLGFEWSGEPRYASDYFDQLYSFAQDLIKAGKAYICSLNAEQVREYRGTLTEPGKNSPDRERAIDESLDLFQKMKQGDFEDGTYTLRAKIDMSSPNINMRDPALYRIKHARHHRTGDTWSIYPMYDFAHGISDAIEGITHSICTLEFEDHRPLYNWFLDNIEIPARPQQIEFARLNLAYFLTSKRKMLELVEDKHVTGWDDPRMPTLAGVRRLGYPAAALRDFCERIGVAKAESLVDIEMLEHCVREDLNQKAQRVMAVLDPLKVVITNYPEDKTEELEAENNPNDPDAGNRMIPFSRELYIEREDFMEDPPKKFFRLAPGVEVRLKHAYYITCTEVIKDPSTGEITELHCTYDPETRGGWGEGFRKVKGTLHWVCAQHAKKAEVRLYERLFTIENPAHTPEGTSFADYINPDSLKVLPSVFVEPSLADASNGNSFQFLRLGYFTADSKDHSASVPVFNRTISLKDSYKKKS